MGIFLVPVVLYSVVGSLGSQQQYTQLLQLGSLRLNQAVWDLAPHASAAAVATGQIGSPGLYSLVIIYVFGSCHIKFFLRNTNIYAISYNLTTWLMHSCFVTSSIEILTIPLGIILFYSFTFPQCL